MENGTPTLEDKFVGFLQNYIFLPYTLTVWEFLMLINLGMLLPYDPITMLFRICPNELKTHVHSKACTRMSVIALYLRAPTWKQLRYSSIA